jgi:hypothetical protein
LAALVPCKVGYNVTLTEPLPAGAVAVMLVDEFTTTLVAGMLPNITVAPDGEGCSRDGDSVSALV